MKVSITADIHSSDKNNGQRKKWNYEFLWEALFEERSIVIQMCWTFGRFGKSLPIFHEYK